MEKHRRPHIRLVYSQGKTVGLSESAPTRVAHQIELFPSLERKSAAIALPLENLHWAEVDQYLSLVPVKQVLDLRELPHFSIPGLSRARFFQRIQELEVNYFHLPALLSATGLDSGLSLSEVYNSERWTSQRAAFSQVLAEVLENGPTVVFTEKSPGNDSSATVPLAALQFAEAELSTFSV